jgi:probable F420-dependent oxidoreductase
MPYALPVSVRIGLGFAGFPFSGSAAFWDWVDLCEESDVDSVWLSERLVSPQPALEPMTALAAVAGRTRRLKFGMNAVVLPFRDPLVLAKECATLDFISDGRLLPMFGVGNDTAPEWRATSREPGGRGRQSNEIIELVTRLWSEDSVSFEGKYYSYHGATISPKPKQQPLPVWIGGSSEAAIERTARLGSGWLGGSGQTPDQAGRIAASIQARAAALNRKIDPDHFGVGVPFRFGDWHEPVVQRNADALRQRFGSNFEPRAVMAVGDAAAMVSLVHNFVTAGISKFVFRPLADSDAEIMDQCRRLAADLIPQVHNPDR